MKSLEIKEKVLSQFLDDPALVDAIEEVFSNAARYEYLRRNDVLVYVARTANDGTSSLLAGSELDSAVDSLMINGDPLNAVFPT